MRQWRAVRGYGRVGAAVLVALSVSACGDSEESSEESSESAEVTTESTIVTTASQAVASGGTSPTSSAAPSTTNGSTSLAPATTSGATGAPGLEAADEVGAGERFEIEWSGPNAEGDYITIVAAGAAAWDGEPYFTTRGASSPGALVAPIEDGEYELWYVDGATERVLARRPIEITPFTGALGAAPEVAAGAEFRVAWNGPDGPGDYVTIVAVGTEQWTNESYFDTSSGSPGTLVAPIEPGEYELWYVTAADRRTMATRPITVTPFEITLEAPEAVEADATFEVEWTGPDGPSDYITIVPAGSPEGTYLSYAYTSSGSPVTLTAPSTPGDYEIWYASDRVEGTFFSIGIAVE